MYAARWRAAFESARLGHRATFRRPIVVRARARPCTVLVVCSPWRYCPTQFARDVASWTRRDITVVVLPPPFAHADGGYEWWAYAAQQNGDGGMKANGLACARVRELRASTRLVRKFVESLTGKRVVLFGSSQGATLAVNVGMSGCLPSRLVRVFAHQPAGLHVDEWRSGAHVLVERCDGFGHGDLAQWRGRVGRGARRVILSISTADRVAPARLVEQQLRLKK